MRYCLKSVRMFTKKRRDNECWQGYGEKVTIMDCGWTCKLGQPLWKTVWRFLKKFLKRITICAFELWHWRRLLRVPWTERKSNQSILKDMQPWIFIGETDAEAEAPIPWPLDVKSQLIGKDPDARINWRQEEKGLAEVEMVGWHQLNGHEFEQTPGDREAWHATVHGVTKSQTLLSDWTTATNTWSRNPTMPAYSFWICNQRKWNQYPEEIPVFSYSLQHYLQ